MGGEANMPNLVPIERIENKIYLIRGQKVMLDRDLADLYGVETRSLKQAVKRNIERFPEDFMFQLNKDELANWRSQFVISKADKKGLRWEPFVFTEQGVSMLSSVLNSKRAVMVNIQIMRTFAKLRETLSSHKDLKRKIEAMESKYDKQFKVVFDAIRALINEPPKKIGKIGFLRDKEG